MRVIPARRRRTLLLGLGIAITACRQSPADAAPSVAPNSEPTKVETPPAPAAKEPTASTPTDDPAKLAALLVGNRPFSVTPETVSEKLASFANLTSSGPQQGVQWKFRTNPSDKNRPAVEARFEKDDNGKWVFTNLRVRLNPRGGDLARLYDVTTAEFRKKLGKPAHEDKSPPSERATHWDLKREKLQLGVEEEVDPDIGPFVRVSLFVPQGEAD